MPAYPARSRRSANGRFPPEAVVIVQAIGFDPSSAATGSIRLPRRCESSTAFAALQIAATVARPESTDCAEFPRSDQFSDQAARG